MRAERAKALEKKDSITLDRLAKLDLKEDPANLYYNFSGVVSS